MGLIGQHETDADASGAGATCAADPVDKGVRVLRHVVVDHVGNVGDVDAAGGHVGGD